MGSGSSKKAKQSKPPEETEAPTSQPNETATESRADDSQAVTDNQPLKDNANQPADLQPKANQSADQSPNGTMNLDERDTTVPYETARSHNRDISRKDAATGPDRRATQLNWGESDSGSEYSWFDEEADQILPRTLDETLPKLRKSIKFLRNQPILDNNCQGDVDLVKNTLENWSKDNEDYEVLLARFVQYNFVELIKDIWKSLFTADLFTEKKKIAFDMGIDLLLCLERILAVNEAACNRALQVGLHQDITGFLLSDPMKPYRMSDYSHRQLAYHFVMILYLILQNSSRAREEFKLCSVIGTLQGLRELRDRRLRSLSNGSFMVQSFLFSEEDDEKYNSRPDSFRALLTVLDNFTKGPSYKMTDYTIEEIIDVLNRLAVNEHSKTQIVQSGGLQLYSRLLKHVYGPEIRLKAAHGIWLLSFVRGPEIRRDQAIMSDLRRLQTNANDELAMTAEGALWTIEEKTKEKAVSWLTRPPDAQTTRTGNSINIFISYAEDDLNMANRIHDHLGESNFSVTMNARMPMDDMAQAIETASIVIICMSQHLKESPRARTEAGYAHHRNKSFAPVRIQSGYEPDGWLDLLLVGEMCIDFGAFRHFEESMDRLIRLIRHKCPPVTNGRREQRYNTTLPSITPLPRDVTHITNDFIPDFTRDQKRHPTRQPNDFRVIPRDPSFTDRYVAPRPPAAVPAPRLTLPPVEQRLPPATRPTSVRDWTQRDVDNWVDKNDLQHLRSWFRGMNGEMLREFAALRKDAPEAYYSNLFRKDLPVNDVLALTKALNRLNNGARFNPPAETLHR